MLKTVQLIVRITLSEAAQLFTNLRFKYIFICILFILGDLTLIYGNVGYLLHSCRGHSSLRVLCCSLLVHASWCGTVPELVTVSLWEAEAYIGFC